MENAASPRARPLDQPLPWAGLGAHRDGRLRLPSFPGCSYPGIQLRAKWPSGGATRTPAGFLGLDNLGGTSGPGERDARVGCVCVCVCGCGCVCVCVCVGVEIAESQSQSTAAPARGRILRGLPRARWPAVLGFTRAHLGPAALAQPPTQTSASHSLQGTFPSPSPHPPSLGSSLLSRGSEEGVTLHKPPI